jgi:type VI secretion system protein ImpE
MWLPFEHLERLQVQAPTKLRDLLWAPAIVRPAETFTGLELGEALLPVIAPLTWQQADPAVRLGRVTEWRELEDGEQAPVGQKMLLVDDEEFPILELRELEITHAPDAST